MPFSPEQARQTRLNQDKLWIALGCTDLDFFDHEDKDVYTLAAEAIEKSGALRAQKRDLEYRLEAQKETNRELCAIDDVGTVLNDLHVANSTVSYYQDIVEVVLVERANARRALCTAQHTLYMVRRISRLWGTPWFSPSKIIDKLVTGFFNGEFDD